MVSEEEFASSSYILSFYNDIENLTNSYASYLNVLVRIQDRYKLKEKKADQKEIDKEIRKMEPEDEKALLEVAEGIRVWIARCYVKLETLQEKIPEMKKGNKELKDLYEKAIRHSVIEKEVVEGFVLKINKVFVEGVLKDLLVKSKDLYKQFLQAD
jgi:predicted phage-related endonuclease